MNQKTTADARPITLGHLSVVRIGPGANCSSIGSVIDTLFVTGVTATALFAGVLAALKTEEIRIVGKRPSPDAGDADAPPREPPPDSDRSAP